MSSRISAGVGEHPCFLTFYNFVCMSLSTKSIDFAYLFSFFTTSAYCFKGIILSCGMLSYLLVENPLASTFHIYSFSTHYTAL